MNGREKQHAESLVEVGVIAAPHGVRGWLKVRSWCEPGEQLFSYRPLRIGGVEYANYRSEGRGEKLRLKLDGIDDRDAAEALKGAIIEVARSQLETLGEDEYYQTDLIGLQVRGLDGHEFGVVDYFIETGANDVMVVKGKGETLIPFARGQVVRAIDLAAGHIEVDWPVEL